MSTIAGLGMAVPGARVTNADLEARFDTSDAWIRERTGIVERRVAAAGEGTRHLAIAAGAAALKDAGLTPDDVGLLVLATATPDQALPATAAFVQDALGTRGGAFDLGAACAGFVYGLVVASGLIASLDGAALVIGAETLSRIVDPDDRGTAVLFGDGAGAAVLVDPGTDRQPPLAADRRGLLSWDMGCDGSAAALLEIPAGERFLRMDGREVFRRAVRVVVDSARTTLERASVTASDVDVFVPHQANRRIIEAACDRLGIAPERTIVNVDRYGNTSAASIPIALAEAAADGRLVDGQLVLLSGFGAGMTWASALFRWAS